ncbi:MAG: NUDIX domain-containing protein, partial [Pseudomonadota bacterium]
MSEIPIRSFLAVVVAIRSGQSGDQVLLLKRAQSLAGTWCYIAGAIEDGEAAWQTGLRELREETGLTPQRYYSGDICEQFYEARRDAITMAPVFVAVIDPSAQATINAEHSAYRWVGFDEAVEMVSFGGQRRVLRWVE